MSERDVKTAAQLVADDATVDLRDHFLKDGQLRQAGKRRITAKSANQRRYLDAIEQHDIVFGIGPAGTGKTYLAMAQAVSYLLAKKVSRIVLARPAVEAGEKLGFLPGDLQEKVNPVPAPALRRALRHARRREGGAHARARHHRSGADRVHARPHAERRLRDSRRGAEHHHRADEDVPDPPRLRLEGRRHRRHHADRSAAPAAPPVSSRRCNVVGKVDGISFVYFDERDVVRHKLVQAIVKAYERLWATRLRFSLTSSVPGRRGAGVARAGRRGSRAPLRPRPGAMSRVASSAIDACARSIACSAARTSRPTCCRFQPRAVIPPRTACRLLAARRRRLATSSLPPASRRGRRASRPRGRHRATGAGAARAAAPAWLRSRDRRWRMARAEARLSARRADCPRA